MNEPIIKLKTTQMLMLGFLLMIAAGGLLLSLPVSSADGIYTPLIDCLFTATSASCVTGLVVVNTAQHWSLFGKIVILLLIQVGGLGFVSIMTIALVLTGRRITLKERMVIQESFSLSQRSGIVRFVKFLIIFTLVMELGGALLLAVRFAFDYNIGKALWYGLFHSISAYCNAGFDVIGSSSLIPYVGDVWINIVVMVLVVTGGLGFPVWIELCGIVRDIAKNKKTGIKYALRHISLHSKLVLISTAVFIVFGAVFTLIFEFNNQKTIGGLSFGGKVLASLFHSVVLRTAGFCSIDYSGLNYSTEFISIMLMLIGGSPCGTAGGIKTIPIVIVVIAVISLIGERDSLCAHKRSIPFIILQKSLTVIALMLSVLFIATTLLTVTEINLPDNFEFIDILFETASALATVGSTIGVTPYLSSAGKVIIMICMFIGRLGPITIALSFLTEDKNKNKIHYPSEDILVG